MCTKNSIKKAYDTIGWSCVIDILSRLGTPANILKCIKACITTPSFSVAVNGELTGFFASKRGLRQGDPLSPLLFIIAMEAFLSSLYVAAQAPNFEFHPKCEGIKLTHVSFADDIFLFAGGTTSSVRVIMDELNKFENFSGLQVNKQKSVIFLAGISDAIRNEMLNITGFSLGRLPMKYLGVPLLSTRLSHNDCQPLIDKIMVRIQAWTSRSLSFAGRLQLLSFFFFWINKNLFQREKPNKRIHKKPKSPQKSRKTDSTSPKSREKGHQPEHNKHLINKPKPTYGHNQHKQQAKPHSPGQANKNQEKTSPHPGHRQNNQRTAHNPGQVNQGPPNRVKPTPMQETLNHKNSFCTGQG